jgi:hypothetical protein
MRDLNQTPPMSQAAFDAMMRRWMMKTGSRYLGLAAGIAAVALILAFVPTTEPHSGFYGASGNVGVGGGASSPGAVSASSGPGLVSSGAAQGGTGSSSGQVSASQGGPSSPGAAVAGTSGPSQTTSVVQEAPGVAKTGVKCGPGVRQFSWSAYAPYCVPAFHGDNGGATAPGVTATTITLTYRLANSAQQTAIDSLAGAANINQTDLVDDLQSYINYFNTQFELYGRKVVLKTFQGQGDYIEEDQGQDLGATQADAVTAHDLGAFGDVTFSLESSQYYEQDLAAEHVIGFSSIGMSQQWFEQYAPYEYSVQGPTGTNAISEATDVVCRRMAGLPAIYAGSPLLQHSERVFGIIYPQTPVYTAEVNQWQQQLQSECGVKPATVIGYSINVAAYEEEAASAMAQMNAHHVTTILCACDPIVDIFLSDAADQQNYYPEWFASYFGDPIGRNYDQKEWSHAITGGFEWPDYTTTEAYRTFERAYPGKQPAETPPSSPRYYYVPYYTLLQVFDALQAAGPDLTPQTFERGMFSLPPSDPGDFIGGHWQFGPNTFDPIVSYNLAWWSPTAVSKFDNTAGAYQWCNSAQTYFLGEPSALGGPGVQLDCFGR